jgi:serine/threonine-protein kinase
VTDSPQPLISPEINAAGLFECAERQFGDMFEIKRLVAASQGRALFVVRDAVLKREAVLRVHMQPNTRGREWFWRETELLASLDHKGLRTVYSAGYRGDWAYRVAKWIIGESLEDAVSRGPRSIPTVLSMARTLTSLLEYIHSHQIAVRRLVPGTIMLESTGRTIVTDLRFASICLDVADQWAAADRPFIAPEIRDGGGGDPRSDIYSVAALLYYALTGRTPRERAELIVPPKELRATSPAMLDRLLMRALQADPSQRYFSAAEMIDDLLSELGDADITIPVAAQSRVSYDDAKAWEKHLRRALGDDYELLEPIGSGGFGTVYKVRDLELEREVALKVLHPFLTSDAAVVERFRREAQVAARVVHQYIVNTYDTGGRSGLLWYTMEYVPGGNLAQVVRREGPLPSDRVVRILRECLAALRHAHSFGLVHRDIKPENILIHPSGSIRIADFGLALALQRPDWHGGASSRSGTPEFAAPEQMLGEPVDHRADLYSLTLCGYFALTGSPPFAGTSPTSILARHAVGQLPDVLSMRLDVPKHIARTLTKGAALSPSDRFTSADEYLKELTAKPRPTRQGSLGWWGKALGRRASGDDRED